MATVTTSQEQIMSTSLNPSPRIAADGNVAHLASIVTNYAHVV